MEILLESLKLGVAPAIIVGIFLIISKILDNRKEEKQVKLNKTIVQSFNELNSFLKYITKDIIDKESERCTFAVQNAFESMKCSIVNHCIVTIINNNIEHNKENIVDNVKHLINTEYYNVYLVLNLYKVNNYKLIESLNVSWQEELFVDIIGIIYNEHLTKEEKIYAINNKLNIRINDYTTHVLNKYKEHE